MAEVALNVKTRELNTKGYLTQLRRNGFVPAVFYKHGEKNLFISVSEQKLKPIIFSSETFLINLKIDESEPQNCIIKEFQLDPVTNKILHVDFHGLKAGEKVAIDIAVHLIGLSIGVKDGGIIQHSLHKLHVECLPNQIPDKIDVDITSLKIGDSIHVKDLDIPNVKILSNMDATIVAIVPPTVHKEPIEAPPITEEAVEPEVIGKGKKAEEEEE